MFVDNLEQFKVDEDTWVISLDAKFRWVDDGLEPHNMLDSLLKSPKAKTSKDGSRYIVVPFQHNKNPTDQTPAQKNLTDTIKLELKKAKIPYQKIEKDPLGNPKLGLLHKLDIKNAPIKSNEGVGQGHGPIGAPLQGPTGIPFLQGIRIYQHEKINEKGEKKIGRSIMTFRVASSKHKDQDRWNHPGVEKKDIFKDSESWAAQEWKRIESDVMQDLMDRLLG
jgi:hypothetical protein